MAALHARAEREGHRYPLTLAATLLERALLSSPSPAGESPWLTALRGFARCMGARVEVEGERVSLVLKEGTAEGERGWTAKRIEERCPPPAGVVFEVKAASHV